MKQFRQKELSVLIKAAATVAICLGVVACGGGGGGGGGTTTDNTNNTNNTPTPTKTNYSQAFQEESRSLPSWETVNTLELAANGIATKDAPTPKVVENELINGELKQCTTKEVDLTKNTKDLVTLSPMGPFWLGGLVQGRDYKLGTAKPLVIRQRAPITIYIDTIVPNGLGQYNQVTKFSETIENPTESKVSDTITDLVRRMGSLRDLPGKFSYSETESFSENQTALSLGLSAKFVSGSVKASLSKSRNKQKNQLAVYFAHQMFVVRMEPHQTPGNFFTSELTKAILDEQVSLGNIGPDNIPLYVSSIVYGRILSFNMSSSSSVDEMRATINASKNAAVARVAVELTQSQKDILNNSEITFTALGGKLAEAEKAARSGDYKSFFDPDPNEDGTGPVPISYELRTLNNAPAAFIETTRFNITQCGSPEVKTYYLETGGYPNQIGKKEPLGMAGIFYTGTLSEKSYTLPENSYFLGQESKITSNPYGVSTVICEPTFSQFSNITLKDGTVRTLPKSVTFKGGFIIQEKYSGIKVSCSTDFKYITLEK